MAFMLHWVSGEHNYEYIKYFLFIVYSHSDGDECAGKPCLNGGVCTDIENGFVCKCRRGFYGATCQQRKGKCTFTEVFCPQNWAFQWRSQPFVSSGVSFLIFVFCCFPFRYFYFSTIVCQLFLRAFSFCNPIMVTPWLIGFYTMHGVRGSFHHPW